VSSIDTIDSAGTASAAFLEELFERYQEDPASVSPDWRSFFDTMASGSGWTQVAASASPAVAVPVNGHQGNGQELAPHPSPLRNGRPSLQAVTDDEDLVAPDGIATGHAVAISGGDVKLPDAPPGEQEPLPLPASPSHGEDRVAFLQDRVDQLVRAYRVRGHLMAEIDPLGRPRPGLPELDPHFYHLTEADLDRSFSTDTIEGPQSMSLRQIIKRLRNTYCRSIGVQFMHMDDLRVRQWLQVRMEGTENRIQLDRRQQMRIYRQMTTAAVFEEFIQKRFLGAKSFSLEGSETLIPLLEMAIERAAAQEIDDVVLAMAHRGRLNVLAHILHKPYEVMLADFEGASREEGAEDEGDVKYHQGYSHDFVTRQGRKMHLSLSPNPSHLELVNPVIEGMVLAKQDYLHDKARTRVVPVQIHGEAAFTGQGTVAETLNLSQLEGYWNGGTIHIIIDNQLGYTATPQETRFTQYPTDIARQIQAPVFHVNADDPEQVVHAARLAIAFRQEFKRDVLIDLKCYRRWGHNEADDPSLTQPLMYAKIKDHPTVATLYGQQLIDAGVVTRDEVDSMRADVHGVLERCQEKAKRLKVKPRTNTFGGVWQGMTWAGQVWDADTGVDAATLKRIGELATRVPEGFHVHRTVQRINQARREMASGERPVDWGGAEMLAFGRLLMEHIPVRLAGQDAQRGTFAHRHAVWHDVETGEKHAPLKHLTDGQGEFVVLNTMLSELAVLGYEYGVTSADPRRLVMWEAQFGDFANGAQLIIDQYISSAEAKWHRMCGIVMLLPHGYEGMGPEHSSARLERYLQLCAKNNMQVVYPSTPSQIFHVLRRQMHRNFRKPLIVMTPKSLLRHRRCVSDISEFTDGGFRNVIDADIADVDKVRRVILCTGKVYYDLLAGLEERDGEGVALVRVEQLYPLPKEELRTALSRYGNAEEVVWVQEEAVNMGAFTFVQPLIEELLPGGLPLRYVGRDEAASPAVGDATQHQMEQQDIVERALDLASDKQLRLDNVPSRVAGADGGGGS
jgi:2-oxoglutarate dehydrogenase E1 component